MKKGEKDLPGLTDEEKPRMRGPKRASKVRLVAPQPAVHRERSLLVVNMTMQSQQFSSTWPWSWGRISVQTYIRDTVVFVSRLVGCRCSHCGKQQQLHP